MPLIVKFPNNRRFSVAEGYQSLVDIPSLIRDVVERPTRTSEGDDGITKERAFSESFGIHQQTHSQGKLERNLRGSQKGYFQRRDSTCVQFVSRCRRGVLVTERSRLTTGTGTTSPRTDSLLSELRASTKSERGPLPSSNFFERGEESAILEKLELSAIPDREERDLLPFEGGLMTHLFTNFDNLCANERS